MMQPLGQPAGLKGRYDLVLLGSSDGKPWSQTVSRPNQTIDIRQYLRLDGVVEYPSGVSVRQVEFRVLDADGRLLVAETARL